MITWKELYKNILILKYSLEFQNSNNKIKEISPVFIKSSLHKTDSYFLLLPAKPICRF